MIVEKVVTTGSRDDFDLVSPVDVFSTPIAGDEGFRHGASSLCWCS